MSEEAIASKIVALEARIKELKGVDNPPAAQGSASGSE